MSQGRGLRSLPVTLIVIGIAFAVAVPSFLISSAQAIRNSAPTSLEGARSASPLLQTNRSLVVAWWDLSSNDIFFDWSGDGGITWNTDKRVNDVPGSATGAGTWQLAIPAMAVDPERGAMYIAWPDSRNGNLDIYAAASTDGGVTWSQNNRVNDDSGSSVQYMVDLAVDSRGTVHAAWEDKRNGSWNIYYSHSTDGGQTSAANVLISTENTPVIYNRPGDYFAIEAGPDDSISIWWTDGRGSYFDILYAKSPSFFNVRITDGSSPFAWQVEPTMAINRTGAVFVGWKETNGSEAAGLRVGFSYSTDQGATWAANILMNQSHPGGGCSNSDPWMGMGPDGRVQYAYLEFNCANGQNGLDVANTSDGETWSTIHYAPGAGGLTDKESIVVDPSGRIYAAWDEGNGDSFCLGVLERRRGHQSLDRRRFRPHDHSGVAHPVLAHDPSRPRHGHDGRLVRRRRARGRLPRFRHRSGRDGNSSRLRLLERGRERDGFGGLTTHPHERSADGGYGLAHGIRAADYDGIRKRRRRGLVSGRVLGDGLRERERDWDGRRGTGRLRGLDRGCGRRRRVQFESDPHVRTPNGERPVVEGVLRPGRFRHRDGRRERMVSRRDIGAAPRLDRSDVGGSDVPVLGMVGGRHIRGRERHRDDDRPDDRAGQLDDGDGRRRAVRHRAGTNASHPRDRPGDRASRRESAPAEGVTFREIPAGATPSSSCTDRTSRRSTVRRRRTRPRNR